MDPGKEADGWDSETQHGARESLTARSGEGMEGNALCLPGQFNKRLLSTFSVSGWAERVVVNVKGSQLCFLTLGHVLFSETQRLCAKPSSVYLWGLLLTFPERLKDCNGAPRREPWAGIAG